jgi:hypothetical protein
MVTPQLNEVVNADFLIVLQMTTVRQDQLA